MTLALALFVVPASVVPGLLHRGRRASARERAAKAAGTFARQFVWVEDDGSVRELGFDEQAYMNTEFHPGDGARPYIKARYSARSPDGRLSGFLPRRKLPGNASVRP